MRSTQSSRNQQRHTLDAKRHPQSREYGFRYGPGYDSGSSSPSRFPSPSFSPPSTPGLGGEAGSRYATGVWSPPEPRRHEISDDLTATAQVIRHMTQASGEQEEPNPVTSRFEYPLTPGQRPVSLARRVWGAVMAVVVLSVTLVCAAAGLAWWAQWELGPLMMLVNAAPFVALLGLLGILGALVTHRLRCLAVLVISVGALVASVIPLWITDSRPARTVETQLVAQQQGQPAQVTMATFTVRGDTEHTQQQAEQVVAHARTTGVQVLSVAGLSVEARQQLAQAGIDELFPYAHVVAQDNPYGVGLWSSTPLAEVEQWPVNGATVVQATVAPAHSLDVQAASGGLVVVAVNVAPSNDLWQGQIRQVHEYLRHQLAQMPGPVVALGQWRQSASSVGLRQLRRQGLVSAADQAGAGWVRSQRPAVRLPQWAGGAQLRSPWPLLSTDHIVVGPNWLASNLSTLKLPDSSLTGISTTLTHHRQ